jgi:hypothetical protein
MPTGFPFPRDDDPEDVAWALTTGSSLWKQGELREALVWLRRALDAAADAEHWDRASELEGTATELEASAGSAAPPAHVPLPGLPVPLPKLAPPPLRRSGSALGPPPVRRPPQHALSAPPSVEVSYSDHSISVTELEDVVSESAPPDIAISDGPGIAPLSGEPPGRLPNPPPRILAALDSESDEGPRGQTKDPSATLLAMVEAVLAEGPGPGPDEYAAGSGEQLIEQVASSVRNITVPPPDRPPSSPLSVEEPSPDSQPGHTLDAEERISAVAAEPAPEPPKRTARASAPPPKPPSITPMPASMSAPPPKPPTLTSPPPPLPVPSEPRSKLDLPPAPPAAEAPEPEPLPFSLDGVAELEALSDEQRDEFIRLAHLDTLGPDEEVRVTGLVLIVDGTATVQASLADVAAVRVVRANVIYAKGSIADTLAMRIVGGAEPVRVAVWDLSLVEKTLGQYPGLLDELQQASDRLQALAGATMGVLGDRLDDSSRGAALEQLEVRVLEPGDRIATKGQPVPGMVIVGTGGLDVKDEGEVVEHLGPGELLFGPRVPEAGAAPADAVASTKGAVILFGKPALAHELLVSSPPLLEILTDN